MEAGATDGVSQGKKKRIISFVVRLLNTLGLKYGPDSTTQDEYDFDQGKQYDASTSLYSGDTEDLPFPAGHGQEGYIYMSSDSVFPACIQAIMPQVTTRDKT